MGVSDIYTVEQIKQFGILLQADDMRFNGFKLDIILSAFGNNTKGNNMAGVVLLRWNIEFLFVQVF